MTTPASRRPCSMVSAPLPGAPLRAPGAPGDSRTRRRAPRPGASGNSPALHFGPAEGTGSPTGGRQPRFGTLAHSHLPSGLLRLARCEKPPPTPAGGPKPGAAASAPLSGCSRQPGLRGSQWLAVSPAEPALPSGDPAPARPPRAPGGAQLLTGARGRGELPELV